MEHSLTNVIIGQSSLNQQLSLLLTATGLSQAWFRQRARFRTAKQVLGHQKVLDLNNLKALLPHTQNPAFNFQVTNGTTVFQITWYNPQWRARIVPLTWRFGVL